MGMNRRFRILRTGKDGNISQSVSVASTLIHSEIQVEATSESTILMLTDFDPGIQVGDHLSLNDGNKTSTYKVTSISRNSLGDSYVRIDPV